MFNFITTNWMELLVALVCVAVIGFLLARGKKDIVYKILYSLVNEAEQQFGAGTGQIKFAYVMEKAYSLLPGVVKLVLTYTTFEKWIETAVSKMKEDLAEKAEITE